MRRLCIALMASLLVGAAALSGALKPEGAPSGEIQVQVEGRNPWTGLGLANDPAEFQFAIVSDRTGGHRAHVFARAVEQINLLRPEFVVSVGDLIEGYTEDGTRLNAEWREFQSYLCRLQMPFFYVPGNHDISSPSMEKLWQDKFGRRYYHFVYRGVLFLMLSSEDPPGVNAGSISEPQLAWLRRVLHENAEARWALLFLHKPMWVSGADKNGWQEVEKALGGRPYTVFAGHIHRYQKFLRNGRRYYQLATTGGVSRMRGVGYGEFDHIVWVTMRPDGPQLANILLDGVLPENLKKFDNDEAGYVQTNRLPTLPAGGKVFFEGSAVPQAYVVFQNADPKARPSVRADAITEPDGSFRLSTYAAFDGAPAGEYAVSIVWRRPFLSEEGIPGPNVLPEPYGRPDRSGLRATVKPGSNEFVFELHKAGPAQGGKP